MKKFSGVLFLSMAIAAFVGMSLTTMVGCGGGSTPAATPPPPQIFPNDESLAQAAPVKLGTSGGNSLDLGAKVCCIGTLGSLWTKTGVTNPVILSNNHVLDRSGTGAAGEAINQPLQLACSNPATPPLTVAHLTQGAALKPVANETTGPCAQDATRAALCGHAPSNVDAAIAEIAAGQVDLPALFLIWALWEPPVLPQHLLPAPLALRHWEKRGQERQDYRSYLLQHSVAKRHDIE